MSSNTAAMQLDVVGSDVEDVDFTLEWTAEDGSPFPWADYSYAYAVTHKGGNVFVLTDGSGITVNTDAGTIAFFAAAGALTPGDYRHGCLLTHTASGKKIQAFLGALTIGEGAP